MANEQNSEPKWWSSLGDIDDSKVLRKIIKHGDIEDIVSKQRISTKFQYPVNNVIHGLKTFTTRSGHFDLRQSNLHDERVKQVLWFLRGMSKLDDGGLIEHWPRDILREVAKSKPRLCHFYREPGPDSSPSNYLEYFKAVEEIHPLFLYNLNDGKSLLQRYPDLELKLVLKGSEMVEPYSSMCHRLVLTIDDRLATRELHPSVEIILLYDDHQYVQDLEYFPNLKRLIIRKCADHRIIPTQPDRKIVSKSYFFTQSHDEYNGYRGYSDHLKLQEVEQSLKCTLNHLDLEMRLYKEEFAVLKAIFDQHPLERFLANSFPKGRSEKDSEEKILVEMILQSNLELSDMYTGTFHLFKSTNNLRNEGETYKFYITGPHVPVVFRNMDQIRRLIIKFPWIQSVHSNEGDEKHKDIIRNLCQEIGQTYDRQIEFIEVLSAKKMRMALAANRQSPE